MIHYGHRKRHEIPMAIIGNSEKIENNGGHYLHVFNRDNSCSMVRQTEFLNFWTTSSCPDSRRLCKSWQFSQSRSIWVFFAFLHILMGNRFLQKIFQYLNFIFFVLPFLVLITYFLYQKLAPFQIGSPGPLLHRTGKLVSSSPRIMFLDSCRAMRMHIWYTLHMLARIRE